MPKNGLVSKMLAGAIITTAVGAAGTGIVANEVRNVKSHVILDDKIEEGDKEVRKEVLAKVDKFNDIVTEIRLEQRELAIYLKQKL